VKNILDYASASSPVTCQKSVKILLQKNFVYHTNSPNPEPNYKTKSIADFQICPD
jgi:hypothetical protein